MREGCELSTVSMANLAKNRNLNTDVLVKEQQLFLDGMRLDVELDEQIKHLADEMKLTAEIKRQFIISVNGGKNNG